MLIFFKFSHMNLLSIIFEFYNIDNYCSWLFVLDLWWRLTFFSVQLRVIQHMLLLPQFCLSVSMFVCQTCVLGWNERLICQYVNSLIGTSNRVKLDWHCLGQKCDPNFCFSWYIVCGDNCGACPAQVHPSTSVHGLIWLWWWSGVKK